MRIFEDDIYIASSTSWIYQISVCLCLWDSRADEPHYSQQEWPIRHELKPGNHNVKLIPLVNSNNILLHPLHIQLELMKKFVKAFYKEGNAFIHLKYIFHIVSDAKLTEGIFNGPQIRELMKNDNFDRKMNNKELNAWVAQYQRYYQILSR